MFEVQLMKCKKTYDRGGGKAGSISRDMASPFSDINRYLLNFNLRKEDFNLSYDKG